ncbi:MAG: hypothetical protein K1W39_15250 [Lachnospiraceae bacterium]|jgi:hypothetical protein
MHKCNYVLSHILHLPLQGPSFFIEKCVRDSAVCLSVTFTSYDARAAKRFAVERIECAGTVIRRKGGGK